MTSREWYARRVIGRVLYLLFIDCLVSYSRSSFGRLVAVGTDTMDDIVGGGRSVAFGQVDSRERKVGEAERTVALLTIEMYMRVIALLVTVATAEFIAHATLFAINDMDDVMIAEKGECTENTTLVDGQDLLFQLAHG